jgi:lipid II:glycine glycyltransferase (peptidoglycan interpeptide bridge formation enzyme)
MIRILIDKEINIDKWNKLISQSSTATFFQTPACYNFYKKIDFMKPFLYGVEYKSELKAVICGYIISEKGFLQRFFSKRAIVPGGVALVDDIEDEVLVFLLKYVKNEFSKKTIYLEIRNLNSYKKYIDLFESVGFQYQKHLNFHLNLSDKDNVEKNLSTNIKRQIKHTRRRNVICELTNNESDIFQLYKILSELYRKKIKLPLFPYEFFNELKELSEAKFFIVKHNNIVVGGIICVLLEKKTVYEWYICGKDFSEESIFPTAFATWSAIEYGITNNFERFDFMGAGKPGEKYGVRDFKAKFGGQLVENGRFLAVNNFVLFYLGSKFINLKKHLAIQ